MRKRGLRPLQVSIPDVRTPESAAHEQSVLVAEADADGQDFDSTRSGVVAPMTSRLIDTPLLRIRIEGDRDAIAGPEQDSDVMVDKPTAVSRSNVQSRIGRLTSVTWSRPGCGTHSGVHSLQDVSLVSAGCTTSATRNERSSGSIGCPRISSIRRIR